MYQKSLSAMLAKRPERLIYEVINGFLWVSDGAVAIRTLFLGSGNDDPAPATLQALGLSDGATRADAIKPVLCDSTVPAQKLPFYTDKTAFFSHEPSGAAVDINRLKMCEKDKNVKSWCAIPSSAPSARVISCKALVGYDSIDQPVRVLLPMRVEAASNLCTHLDALTRIIPKD